MTRATPLDGEVAQVSSPGPRYDCQCCDIRVEAAAEGADLSKANRKYPNNQVHQVVTQRQIPGRPGNVGAGSRVAASVLEQLDRADPHALLCHRLVRRAFPLHTHIAQAAGNLG